MIANPGLYRRLIDLLVRECHDGQGDIGPWRARSGVWNENARPGFIEDQYAINQFLNRLDSEDREIIAGMLARTFEEGVFNTLRILYENQVSPFEDGYEGTPFNDFIGRLQGDWEWPNE